MLPALDATLDDRALEDARDLIEGDRALGKLLTDDGQGRAGGAADAEGQVSRVAAHDGHEEPLVRRRGVPHEIPHEILAHVDRRRVPERRDAGRQRQVVVDGLGHMGDLEPAATRSRHGRGGGCGVVAADRHQVRDAEALQRVGDGPQGLGGLRRIRP